MKVIEHVNIKNIRKKYVLSIDPGEVNLAFYLLRFGEGCKIEGCCKKKKEEENELLVTSQDSNDINKEKNDNNNNNTISDKYVDIGDIYDYHSIWTKKINLKERCTSDYKRDPPMWEMVIRLVEYMEKDEEFANVFNLISKHKQLSVINIEEQEGFKRGESPYLVHTVMRSARIATAIQMYFFLQGFIVRFCSKGTFVWGNKQFPSGRENRKKFGTIAMEVLLERQIQMEMKSSGRSISSLVLDSLLECHFDDRNHMTDAALSGCLMLYNINTGYSNKKKKNMPFPREILDAINYRMKKRKRKSTEGEGEGEVVILQKYIIPNVVEKEEANSEEDYNSQRKKHKHSP